LKRYPTRPLACWNKAKELRLGYYQRYKDPARLRWSGSSLAFDALPRGLGTDVSFLAGEPYAASIAFNRGLSLRCMEAAENRGWARDLCSHLRNYLGSMYLDEYNYGGPFPRPDFCFTSHICCTHGKWYEIVSEYEKAPYFCVDISAGAGAELNPNKVDYVVNQLHEAIEWMERVTGREFQDELFIEAVKIDFRSTSTWAEICTLNKHIPAPLDEKTMHSLYVFGAMDRCDKEFAGFFDELRDEVKERVAQGIAAVPQERCRLMTDIQPPWHFLDIYRYLEQYGAVSIGSHYVYGLTGMWEDQPDGTWGPARTPMDKGIQIRTRDQALHLLVEWFLRKPTLQHWYDPQLKTDMMVRLAKEWRLDGMILHFNRGCEGVTLGIAENRLGLMKAGVPVMTYEGNMADPREFDESKTLGRIDSFMESLGYGKLPAD